jgi:hypothetical protein
MITDSDDDDAQDDSKMLISINMMNDAFNDDYDDMMQSLC